MTTETLLFLAMLSASGAPAAVTTPTPEESAAGTVRSIISAEAYHKQKFPSVGYACDIETLVKADALVAELAGGNLRRIRLQGLVPQDRLAPADLSGVRNSRQGRRGPDVLHRRDQPASFRQGRCGGVLR